MEFIFSNFQFFLFHLQWWACCLYLLVGIEFVPICVSECFFKFQIIDAAILHRCCCVELQCWAFKVKSDSNNYEIFLIIYKYSCLYMNGQVEFCLKIYLEYWCLDFSLHKTKVNFVLFQDQESAFYFCMSWFFCNSFIQEWICTQKVAVLHLCQQDIVSIKIFLFSFLLGNKFSGAFQEQLLHLMTGIVIFITPCW